MVEEESWSTFKAPYSVFIFVIHNLCWSCCSVYILAVNRWRIRAHGLSQTMRASSMGPVCRKTGHSQTRSELMVFSHTLHTNFGAGWIVSEFFFLFFIFFLFIFFTLMENGVIYILLALKIWILIHITWWDAHALTTQALYVWWGVDWTFFDVIFILNQSIKFNRHINNCLNVLPNSGIWFAVTNVMHRQYSG